MLGSSRYSGYSVIYLYRDEEGSNRIVTKVLDLAYSRLFSNGYRMFAPGLALDEPHNCRLVDAFLFQEPTPLDDLDKEEKSS